MSKPFLVLLVFAALVGTSASAVAQQPPSSQSLPAPPSPAAPAAQAPAPGPAPAAPAPEVIATTPCGDQLTTPAALPPAGSPPFIWILQLCFNRQGGSPNVESETYMYYVKLKSSTPSQGIFVPYDEKAEQQAIADFKTLMFNTNFLEDMKIEVTDHTFPNGVVGKIVTYDMEERERVKI